MSDVRQDRDGNLIVKDGLSEIKDNKGHVYQISDAGIDDTGKSLKIAQKKSEWISPTKLRLPSGKIISFDPNEKCFEVYNNYNKDVFFVNCHYNPAEKMRTPQVIKIPPDSFGFIPHSYYTFYVGYIGNMSMEKIDLVVNHGDMMFKGNKKLSAPEKRLNLGNSAH